jgi:hypothetical protein
VNAAASEERMASSTAGQGYARRMTDEHRADTEKVREVAADLGSPGQDVTPDERDSDDRDPLRDEIRRRRTAGDDEPLADRDSS